MKATQLDSVGQPLSVREIPVPKSGKGEVLVKMAASPINPSDQAFMMGEYTFKIGLPVTPGNEGSGVVAAPHETTIMSYGRLSTEPCIIEPGALILHHKNINGFFLRDWMQSRNLIQVLGDISKVKSLLGSDMHTPVKMRLPLSEVNKALEAYKAEMTRGKILLVRTP